MKTAINVYCLLYGFMTEFVFGIASIVAAAYIFAKAIVG